MQQVSVNVHVHLAMQTLPISLEEMPGVHDNILDRDLLAYNCSPSFNLKPALSDDQVTTAVNP